MKLLRTGLAAAALALSFGGGAQAAPFFAPGQSDIFYNNFENLYRSVAACAAIGGCLGATAGDPPGLLRADPTIPGNVFDGRVPDGQGGFIKLFPGDIFIGILNVQNVTSATLGTDTYNSNPGTRFTGYFAQQVDSFGGPGPHTTGHVNLTTVADPLGILLPGEMFRFYSDTATFLNGNGTKDITASVAAATSGNFWGSMGIGSEGFAYTHTDLSAVINASNTENFFQLDLLLAGPAYSGGFLNKLNGFNEDEIGGAAAAGGDLLCTAAEIAGSAISCNDFAGTSEIESNSTFYSTNPAISSAWMFASNDPVVMSRIPEPGSLALLGVALAGLGLSRRRRSV